MTSSSYHDFDPITKEDIEEFNNGLEHGKPTEILQMEMAQRALDKAWQIGREKPMTQAGGATPEEVAYISKLLSPVEPSDEGKVAKYPPDPVD